MNTDQTKEIIKLYTVDKLSSIRIGKRFNISDTTVLKILKKNNIPRRNNRFYRTKYSWNTDFFSNLNSELSSYWLGFLYADGFITKNILGIALSEKDRDHLECFKAAINSDHPILTYPMSGGQSGNRSIINIRLTPAEIENFKSVGMFPRKSLRLKWPTNLNVIDNHFIRGYFDGDGSVYKSKGHSPNFQLNGTFEFLKEIQNRLPVKTNIYDEKRRKSNTWYLRKGGRIALTDIYEYLYNNSTIFMDRKKTKFKKVIKFNYLD